MGVQVSPLVRHMLKNNVPAPSCIPPAGLEVLTRRFVLVLVLERGYSYGQLCGSALSELHPRGGLKMLKGGLEFGHLGRPPSLRFGAP